MPPQKRLMSNPPGAAGDPSFLLLQTFGVLHPIGLSIHLSSPYEARRVRGPGERLSTSAPASISRRGNVARAFVPFARDFKHSSRTPPPQPQSRMAPERQNSLPQPRLFRRPAPLRVRRADRLASED